MYFSHTLLSSLLALLASSSLASAVCTGDEFAIGTPSANAATGLTTYTIYTAGTCAVSQTLSVNTANPTVCDSEYFYCAAGTTTIDEYDDPTTGTSYTCSPDTVSEKCGADTIAYCCEYGVIGQ